jgi:hypothetical protein
MLLGKYANVPFAEPTLTTWTVTAPLVPVAAAVTPEDVEEPFAREKDVSMSLNISCWGSPQGRPTECAADAQGREGEG